MFCRKCGTEFDGKFCPNCGEAAPELARPDKPIVTRNEIGKEPKQQTPSGKKDNATLCMTLGILSIFCSFFCFGWIMAIISLVLARGCKDTSEPAKRTVGIVTSWICIILTVVVLIAAAVMPTSEETGATDMTETVPVVETQSAPEETETEWDMQEANEEKIEQIESAMDSIEENVDDIVNDPEVQEAYEGYKDSLKQLFGGE